MFVVDGESQTEIFGYNTKLPTFLKKLGKFTKLVEKQSSLSWNYKQYSKVCVAIKNHNFWFSIISKHFSKKLIKEKKIHIVIFSH